MIKKLLIIPFVMLMYVTNGQSLPEKSSSRENTFIKADVMPAYPGGMGAMYNYMATSIIYPAKAKEKKIEGKVFVNFVVTKEGKVTDVQVKHPKEKLLDNEAIRVVQSMPAWTPGTVKGEPVNVEMTLPVSFKLQE